MPSLKINFSNVITPEVIQHHNKLASDLSLAKGNEFNLSFDSINPIPSDDDFVDIPLRHLSATIVGAKSWKATDFSNVAVLKKGMKLLEKRPVYLNHNLNVGNEIGTVGSLKFTPSYVNKQGVTIPAGIDGPIVIDSKLYPEYVRKMSGKNPSITSCSVTVMFDWEPSHEFEDPNDFYWKLGSTIDGKMVCRVVTKITEFYETSLVWNGADPFAGLLDEDNEVKYIDRDGIVSLSASNKVEDLYNENKQLFIESCLGGRNSLSLSHSKGQKQNNNMEKLLKFIADKLGLPVGELTEEAINSFVFSKKEAYDTLVLEAEKSKELAEFESVKTQLTEKESEITSLSSEVETLTTEKNSLQSQVDSFESEITSLQEVSSKYDDVISKRRNYAIEMYTKSVDGEVDEIISNELKEESDLQKLEAKIKMYGGKAINSFGASCKDCKSDNIGFRSSSEDDEFKEDGIDKKESLSFAEKARLRKSQL